MGVCSHTGSRKAVAGRGGHRPAGGGGCQGRACPRSSLGLDFRVLLGLERALAEPPAIILGNYKRPEVPGDWERINLVLSISAKRGERWMLVILSRSFNIWETPRSPLPNWEGQDSAGPGVVPVFLFRRSFLSQSEVGTRTPTAFFSLPCQAQSSWRMTLCPVTLSCLSPTHAVQSMAPWGQEPTHNLVYVPSTQTRDSQCRGRGCGLD